MAQAVIEAQAEEIARLQSEIADYMTRDMADG
jgi:hypothetical protein